MQDDTFPAAEKILSDIENVVKRNSSLKSFEIIPAEDNENKSPVFHQEEALGLASWCVQPLYCYVYRRLVDLRQSRHRREEPSTVARWLLGALLLNPEVGTFWNMRRELVRARKLEPVEELAFARLVLYNKPKCFEVFAYRRWLLSYIFEAKESTYDPEPTESLLCAELELIDACADRYANNYQAWSHRRHVFSLRDLLGHTHPTLESEWRSSLAWYHRHVSDHSCLSYRQFLLRKFLYAEKDCPKRTMKSTEMDNYEQRREELVAYMKDTLKREGAKSDDQRQQQQQQQMRDVFGIVREANGSERTFLRDWSYWAEECRENENKICLYNDQEALWYHHRFLAHLLRSLNTAYHMYVILSTCIPSSWHMSVNFDLITVHDFLLKCFTSRTTAIMELAAIRDPREKILVDRFTKFARSLGFDIAS